MDPATIAAILAEAKKYYDEKKELDWKAGVSQQLAEISRKVDIVIGMLHDLKVWLNEKIEDVAPNIFQHQIDGNILVIQNNAPAVRRGTASRQQKRDLGDARFHLTQNIGEILDWQRFGFTYYYKVIAAVTFQLYATKALGEALLSQRAIIETVIGYLSAAIDPTPEAVKSVEHARQVKEGQRNAAALEIINRRDRWWLTNLSWNTEQQGRDEFATRTTFYDWITRLFHGEPGGPYQFQENRVEGNEDGPNEVWYPGIRQFDYGDGGVSYNDMLSDLNRLTAIFLSLKAEEQILAAHVLAIKSCIKMLEDVLRSK